jgi:hypothetical protein
VNHQVRRVCLDDGAGARFANHVGLGVSVSLQLSSLCWVIFTMSQPSFAEAIAEKYGAPV